MAARTRLVQAIPAPPKGSKVPHRLHAPPAASHAAARHPGGIPQRSIEEGVITDLRLQVSVTHAAVPDKAAIETKKAQAEVSTAQVVHQRAGAGAG
jgi:hypothetical protein